MLVAVLEGLLSLSLSLNYEKSSFAYFIISVKEIHVEPCAEKQKKEQKTSSVIVILYQHFCKL